MDWATATDLTRKAPDFHVARGVYLLIFFALWQTHPSRRLQGQLIVDLEVVQEEATDACFRELQLLRGQRSSRGREAG